MMEYLSSMYIDNEMDMDEKIKFVEKIKSDQGFYRETLELLEQEQLISRQVLLPEVPVEKKWGPPVRSRTAHIFSRLGWAGAGFAAAALMLFFLFQSPELHVHTNRFVLFEPSAGQVDLTGSFTGWDRIPMKRVGKSGYWELNLPVNFGEHRFAYILDNEHQISDPTMIAREKDDFGGENSILWVEESI